MAADYAALKTPDEDLLEYTPVPGERDVLAGHLRSLVRETAALRASWRRLAVELLAIRWPGAADRTTTLQRLREAGLPGLDDPEDLW